MARLPTRESLGPRPTPRSQRKIVPIRADIAESAAAAGFRSNAEIASAVSNISADQSKQFAKEDAEREARDLNVEYANAVRLLQRGDGTDANPGYLNLKGENAINAREGHLQALEKLNETMLGKASSPRVSGLVVNAFQSRFGTALDSSVKHFGVQRVAANKASHTALQASIADDAAELGAAGDSEGVAGAAKLAGAQAAAFALQTGADPKFEAEAAETKIHIAEIQRRAIDNVGLAREYFEQNKDRIDGRRHTAIEKMLGTARSAAANEVTALSRDHFASIQATGAGIDGLREKAQAVMDADDFKEFVRAEDNARDFRAFTVETAFAPPEEMGRQLEALRPKPGSKGFADRQRTFEAANRAAHQIVTARAKDPAGYAMTRPAVAAAFQRVQDGTLSLSAATTMLLGAQADMGIPPRNRRRLAKTQAVAMVGEIEALPASERATQMATIGQQYSEHFLPVLKELVEEGLSPETQVLTSVLGDVVVMSDLANAIELGPTELKKGLDQTETKDLSSDIVAAVQPFASRVFAGAITAQRVEQVNNLTKAMENLALFYMRKGSPGNDAAARAYDALIGKRYDLETFPTAYIPTDVDGVTINVAKVEALAAAKLTHEIIEEFDPLPIGDPGPLDVAAHREATINAAVNSGFWVTNPTGTGLILMVPIGDGGAVQLLRGDLAPFQVGFADATRSDVEILQKFQPGGGVEKARGKAARKAADIRQREIDELKSRARP